MLPTSRHDREHQSYRENNSKVVKAVVIENDIIDRGAYGAIETTDLYPFVSGSAVYGFIPSNFRTFLVGTGTASVVENYFKVTSGASLGDYGVIRSFRSVNYKVGQGAVIRTAARFDTPQASSWSGVGGFNLGDEVSFGYNGLNFGVWHRYNGKAEVRTLTLTVGASGAETATVTINGTAYNIPITAGTVQKNADEIQEYLNANQENCDAEQLNDKVILNFLTDGSKDGTFSYSSTGTSAGSFTRTTQGVTKTSDHVAMSDWNQLPNGPSGFDPSKGNNYEIKFQNGYGDIKYFIQNPVTGRYDLVHVIEWSNMKTTPNLYNPSLHIGCYATALGSITAVSVEMSYTSAFINGTNKATRNPRAYANTKTIDTTNTNILSIRSSRTYNGISNQVEIDPTHITLSNDGAKTAIFEIRTAATIGGNQNFQEIGTNLMSNFDISGTTVTNGRLIASFTVAKGQTAQINLKNFDIRVPPSLVITISGRMASGAASDLSASLTWYEDI